MKILFAAAEAVPFAKSGGLGDVIGALPAALAKTGAEVNVVMPYYQDIPQKLKDTMTMVGKCYVPLSWRRQYCGIFTCEKEGVHYYFLDNLYYFGRRGLYGYYDDAERFAFFSRALLEVLPDIGGVPDIIHCNDWHTGLVPLYLNRFYRQKGEAYQRIRVVYTIHNLQYQGSYSPEITEDVLGLSWGDYENGALRFGDSVNYVKTGIQTASWVTTVSPSYAGEIQTPAFGFGLDSILRDCSVKLSGIINGIDTDANNPATDSHLFAPYSVEDRSGKAVNKSMLQKMLGLPERPDTPIIAIVSRLVDHKGMNLVSMVLREILNEDIQLVVLGTGEWQFEEMFRRAAFDYPDKVSANITFDSDLAQKIYAGADLFLMPSLSEPCGLSQLIAMRYGTVPIVRETGGLKDTVHPFSEIDQSGNGFTFASANAYDMLYVLKEGLGYYRNPELWNKVVTNAMNTDSSWDSSAKIYLALYEKLIPPVEPTPVEEAPAPEPAPVVKKPRAKKAAPKEAAEEAPAEAPKEEPAPAKTTKKKTTK